MFSKKFRLPASIQLSHPIFCHAASFSVKISKNTLTYNRYGFVVGKKIDKRATERNKVKRRFRSCVEQLHPHLQQGYDMLFMLKIPAKEQSTENLYKEIKTVIERIKE